MLQVKQAKEEERQKERRWAFLHRLERKGVAFVAGGGVVCCYGLPQALPEVSSGASPSHRSVPVRTGICKREIAYDHNCT